MSENNIVEATTSRRGFIKGLSTVVAGAAAASCAAGVAVAEVPAADFAANPSKGYLVFDSKKCAGCMSCMHACSLAHEGKVDLNLSRIQIKRNAFGTYPTAIMQNICRQCLYPACAYACPEDAIYADPETGIRMIDEGKCTGCGKCVEACALTPSRIQVSIDSNVAFMCDLCAKTPHWDQEGGINGKQACIEACQMRAIQFTTEMPAQNEYGYDVNLRNIHFARVGFPIDDAGMQPAVEVL